MATLRTRRWLAAGVLVATCFAFFGVFAGQGEDLAAELRMLELVALLMVLGTLAFGLAVWLLRCPRCGTNVARKAVGGFDEKSVVTTLVALLRPLTCPHCGFDEGAHGRGP